MQQISLCVRVVPIDDSIEDSQMCLWLMPSMIARLLLLLLLLLVVVIVVVVRVGRLIETEIQNL